jgi:hypothetical protein
MGEVVGLHNAEILGLVTESDGVRKLADLDLDHRRQLQPLARASLSAPRIARQALAWWHVRVRISRQLRRGRSYGSLTAVTDSEMRSLRSVTASAYEAASRTDDLLAGLIAIRGVRIFRGVRTAGADLPAIPHAVIVGRRLVLIESVVWPGGHYETAADGRICCDGTYTGQSAMSFLSAVQQWRKAVPGGHDVTAMTVVHAQGGAAIRLPSGLALDLAWVRAEEAIGGISQRLACSRQRTSPVLLAALLSATESLPDTSC